jgi:hypothetical protein
MRLGPRWPHSAARCARSWRRGVRVLIIEPATINSGAAGKVARDAAVVMAAAPPPGRSHT